MFGMPYVMHEKRSHGFLVNFNRARRKCARRAVQRIERVEVLQEGEPEQAVGPEPGGKVVDVNQEVVEAKPSDSKRCTRSM